MLLPADLAHAPVVVEFAQVAHMLAGGKSHAAEERVAHQQRAAATVRHDLVDALRRRGVEGCRVASVFPLVYQARVDRAHHKAQPRDNVAQALVALRWVRCGRANGKPLPGSAANALGAGDAELLNVALKIARAFQHIAQDALGRELVVVCPGYFLAVLVKSGVEQILERLFVRDVLNALQTLLILDAVGLHLGHSSIACGTLPAHAALAWDLRASPDH